MARPVFGEHRLCRTCGGAGRLHKGKRISLELVAQLCGVGPVEIDGRLVIDPTPEQLAAIRAEVIDRTRPCNACAGSGLVSE